MFSADSVDLLVGPLSDSGRRHPRRGEPVRLGVPLARGQTCGDRLSVIDQDGLRRTAQGRVLDRWPDGSVRWMLVDFLADHDGSTGLSHYRLDLARSVPDCRPAVQIETSGEVLRVDTVAARFELAVGARFPFGQVSCSNGSAIDADQSGVTVSEDGCQNVLRIDKVVVEDRGPVRAVVRVEAKATGRPGLRGVILSARLHFFAGSAAVRCDLSLRNTRPARHPGGFWELGDTNSILLEDLALSLVWPRSGEDVRVCCSVDREASLSECGPSMELFQASSGGDRWDYRTHVNREGRVPLEFRGYRIRSSSGADAGMRATPLVTVANHAGALAATVPQFWQNFPQAITVDRSSLQLQFLPRQHRDGHELQAGEQKTWMAMVAFGVDSVTAEPLAWARTPLLARLSPQQYCRTGAVPYLLSSDEGTDANYERLVSAAIEGSDTFEKKREVIDEYGWRNFGDLYADHENTYYEGQSPVVSHYNNQYDAIAGMALQFMRSGDSRWWQPMLDCAGHVVDIDMYHTVEDRSIYDRGLFWHSAHYTDAGLSTHRAYPRAPGIYGGGPANEHNYAAGLMWHHFLTGDPASREAAIELATWVVEMDDGRKRVFRWLAGGDSGFASATGTPDYHGPGRGAGNSIAVLLVGFRLTGDRMFLEKAEALIRRCVHGLPPTLFIDLLNAEVRWSYVVFLHALGRYLDEKVELGEVDTTYAYAQRALLAYADWMVRHERPYLDRVGELQYPTETWAAQEIWKSDVLAYAARYAPGTETSKAFLDRSAFFYRCAVDSLERFPTRTLTRPVVLLLSRGMMHRYLLAHPETLEVPDATGMEIPPPAPRFVTQKSRALKRFRWIAGAGLLAIGAATVWLLRALTSG